MNVEPTKQEIDAARALGEATLRFVLALDRGRHQRRPPAPVVVKVAPPTPKPEAPAPIETLQRSAPVPPAVNADAPVPKQLLLRPKEAAKFLSIGERLLWTLTQPRGHIPCMKIGRAVLYPVDLLREWIRDETTKKRR